MKPTITAAIACTAAFMVGTFVGCESAKSTREPATMTAPATREAEVAKAPPATKPAPTSQPVVAMVNGTPITLEELDRPLIDAYGLGVLMNLSLREVARQEAEQAHVTVTQADFDHERETTLDKIFKDGEKKDYDKLLDQMLSQQRISRPEFELVIQTNAYLRKIAEPQMKDKITEDGLQQAFRTIYGENVEVRDIQLANMQEIRAVQQRLEAGEAFEKVAREASRDPRTKAGGGQLPPFSREAGNVSQAFKDAAFALREPGEVSDPVQTGESFHLIQLIRKIEPKAVKFEDVKESVRQQLYDGLMFAAIAKARAELGVATIQAMDIKDPSLKKQFVERQEKQHAQSQERERVRLEDVKQRKELSERQTVEVPAATQPAGGTEARERPPATKSGQ